MPTYEMPILLRIMKKPDTVAALKRITNVIFDKGGFLRKIDNLGEQQLPNKMSVHNKIHRHARYIILHVDFPPRSIPSLMDEFNRDLDIIRNRVYVKPDENAETPECTWHEEMLPPPYRADVQQLMKVSEDTRKKKVPQFQFNSGLDYYPFQR
ncbi:probable 28S ribosomal protein S6, mitochondrial [Chelonus insularis]|uniref:probable 28S ribosomal protein S6, mitochondrial n=1 Tax=Chelonus insularis TaxID=460826 RepID=UPI00158A2ADF|nr:probable 28S ribosomal protein S6, mitochondrial [Chelonus insularis]